jgi:arylsulfatase A-like enzyme
VEGYVTNVITDKAIDWMDKRDESKPFLLMINHKAPHRTWEKGPERLNLYEDTTFPEPENLFDNYNNRGTAAKTQEMEISKHMRVGVDLKVYTEQNKGAGFYKRLNPEQRKAWDNVYEPIKRDFLKLNLEGDALTKWKYQRYMRDYLAVVRSVDDNVGRVIDYLEKHHLTENTIIVYSSDQGFYLGEHGWFDKRFMYEESFRTPLLIKWPKVIKAGSVNNDLVSNLDFAQTFIDVAGGKSPDVMQGLSLAPLLRGEEPKNWRKSLYYHYYDFPAQHNVQPHEGVATKQYKLIHFYTINEWELYDLEKDPHEMKSEYLNSKYSNVVKTMKQELEKLKHQYKAENTTNQNKKN